MIIPFVSIVCVLTKHVDASSMRFRPIDVGNPTGNLIASAEVKSKLACAAHCLTLQSEIFDYVAPMCSCYEGSSVGATFVAPDGTSVLYGMAQVNNTFVFKLYHNFVKLKLEIYAQLLEGCSF